MIIANAPWWRCLHCGCDEYEEHVFTGLMKGTPMIHCANCKIMHSPPSPNSGAAMRWQISELADALHRIASAQPGQHEFDPFAMRDLAAQAIEAQRAATTGAVEDESAVAASDAPKE